MDYNSRIHTLLPNILPFYCSVYHVVPFAYPCTSKLQFAQPVVLVYINPCLVEHQICRREEGLRRGKRGSNLRCNDKMYSQSVLIEYEEERVYFENLSNLVGWFWSDKATMLAIPRDKHRLVHLLPPPHLYQTLVSSRNNSHCSAC